VKRLSICVAIYLLIVLCPGSRVVHSQLLKGIVGAGGCVHGSVTYTSPGTGTWSVPPGCTGIITVEAWGAGGGASNTSGGYSSGGGGGGTYAKSLETIPPGTVLTYTVGAGGNFASDDPGASGGTSGVTDTISPYSVAEAYGGTGAYDNYETPWGGTSSTLNNITRGGGVTYVGGAGGNSFGGLYGGGGGGGATSSGAGTAGGDDGGGGGSYGGGSGGTGFSAGIALSPGGGAGGNSATGTAYTAGNGQVRITW
jgi:hypothetical protein